jgi:hypothetical protein
VEKTQRTRFGSMFGGRILAPGIRAPTAAMIMASAVLVLSTGSANAEAREREIPAPIGPPPDWDRYRELGERAIRSRLVDPDSARFEWPYGYSAEGFRPFLRGRQRGYATCGTVNAHNRMGGFAGRATFVVVIDDDRIVYSEVGSSRGTDLLAAACERAVSRGRLPPAPEDVRRTGGITLESIGLETATAPNGIVIISVEPESAAARAGLRQGMLLTEFNGIALGGLGEDALPRILGAAEERWAFTTREGTTVAVDRPQNPTPADTPVQGKPDG